MFSFLDMINSSLSYFNLDVKLKSRIYIIIATLGDIYLVYVTSVSYTHLTLPTT